MRGALSFAVKALVRFQGEWYRGVTNHRMINNHYIIHHLPKYGLEDLFSRHDKGIKPFKRGSRRVQIRSSSMHIVQIIPRTRRWDRIDGT